MSTWLGLSWLFPKVLYSLPVVLLPLLIHFSFRFTRKKIMVPSLFIFLQIKKKLGFKRHFPIWLLLFEMLFLFFLILGMARPCFLNSHKKSIYFIDNGPELFIPLQGTQSLSKIKTGLTDILAKSPEALLVLSWKEFRRHEGPTRIETQAQLTQYFDEIEIDNSDLSFKALVEEINSQDLGFNDQEYELVYLGLFSKQRFQEPFLYEEELLSWDKLQDSFPQVPILETWKTTFFENEKLRLIFRGLGKNFNQNELLILNEVFSNRPPIEKIRISKINAQNSELYLTLGNPGFSFYEFKSLDNGFEFPLGYFAFKTSEPLFIYFENRHGDEGFVKAFTQLFDYDFKRQNMRLGTGPKYLHLFFPGTEPMRMEELNSRNINIIFIKNFDITLDFKGYFRELTFEGESKIAEKVFFQINPLVTKIPSLKNGDFNALRFKNYQKILGGEVLLRFDNGDPFLIKVKNDYLFTADVSLETSTFFSESAAIPLLLELFTYAKDCYHQTMPAHSLTTSDFLAAYSTKAPEAVIVPTNHKYLVKPGIYREGSQLLVVNHNDDFFTALSENQLKKYLPNLKRNSLDKDQFRFSVFQYFSLSQFCFFLSYLFFCLAFLLSQRMVVTNPSGRQ